MRLNIGRRVVGDESPCFIVAELSANHRQSYALAEQSVYAAGEAGADAVKLQTYTPDTLTIQCESELFRLNAPSPWAGRTLYSLYQEGQTPWEWHGKLRELANSLGMELFSSPFDPTAADYLRKLDMPAYKIASFEIFDIPLIRLVASYGKPVIISTGAAEEGDIGRALDACYAEGNRQIILLQCTSAYPAPLEKANLALMSRMREQFHTLTGLSDHTKAPVVPVAAVAAGACMIEKHFILDHGIDSLDGAFSLDAREFKAMVDSVREAEAAMGDGRWRTAEETAPARRLARSVFVVRDIKKGELFTPQNIRSIRPGMGLPPRYLPEVLGKKALCDLPAGTPLALKHVALE